MGKFARSVNGAAEGGRSDGRRGKIDGCEAC